MLCKRYNSNISFTRHKIISLQRVCRPMTYLKGFAASAVFFICTTNTLSIYKDIQYSVTKKMGCKSIHCCGVPGKLCYPCTMLVGNFVAHDLDRIIGSCRAKRQSWNWSSFPLKPQGIFLRRAEHTTWADCSVLCWGKIFGLKRSVLQSYFYGMMHSIMKDVDKSTCSALLIYPL